MKTKKKKKASDEEDHFVIPESALKPASIPVTKVEPSLALAEITETLTVKTLKRKQKNDKSKRLKEEAIDTTVEKASRVPDKIKTKKKKKASDEEYDFVIPESALKPASLPVTDVELSLALAENTHALTVKTLKRKKQKDKSKRLKEKPEESVTGPAADSLYLFNASKKPQASESPAAEKQARPVSSSGDLVSDGGQSAESFDEMGAISETPLVREKITLRFNPEEWKEISVHKTKYNESLKGHIPLITKK